MNVADTADFKVTPGNAWKYARLLPLDAVDDVPQQFETYAVSQKDGVKINTSELHKSVVLPADNWKLAHKD